MQQRALILSFSLLLAFSVTALADVPLLIDYQGDLRDSSGVPYSDGNYTMEFRLFTVDSGGTAQWTETRTGGNEVAVEDGLFSVKLGAVQALASSLFASGTTLYLEVCVDSDGDDAIAAGEVFTPRERLSAAPYAIEADLLDGNEASAFATSAHTHDGRYYTETELNTSGGGGAVHWDNVTNAPSGLADGDDDTTYTAGGGLDLTTTTFSHTDTSSQADVNNSAGTVIQDVGVDGYGHVDSLASVNLDGRYYTETEISTSGSSSVHWGNLTNVPAGLADGDDNTTYSAGDGLDLGGTSFSVDVTDLLGTGLTESSNNIVVSYGSSAGTACQGNDARLSDSRAPTGSAGGDLSGTYPNPSVNNDSHTHDTRYFTETETDGRYLRLNANTTQNDGLYLASDQLRARDSGGLALYDDAGGAGVFVEDGGDVGVNMTSPRAPLEVSGVSSSDYTILTRGTAEGRAGILWEYGSAPTSARVTYGLAGWCRYHAIADDTVMGSFGGGIATTTGNNVLVSCGMAYYGDWNPGGSNDDAIVGLGILTNEANMPSTAATMYPLWLTIGHDSISEVIVANRKCDFGIGLDPSYRLDVVEDSEDWVTRIRSTGSTNCAVYLAHGSGYGAYIDGGADASSSTYQLQVAGGAYLYVRGDGPVAINGTTIATDYELTVNGDLCVYGSAYKSVGGVDWVSSDRRVKQQIAPVRDAIATLMMLEPVSFHYREDYLAQHGNVEDRQLYGYIAQDYGEVFPDAVKEGPNGYLAMDDQAARVYTVKAVQELVLQNRQLQHEVDSLRDDLRQLQRAVENLQR